MRALALITCLLSAAPAWAETVFAARTVRAQAILTAQDLVLKKVDIPGAITRPEALSRVALKHAADTLREDGALHRDEAGLSAVPERRDAIVDTLSPMVGA